MNLEAISLLRFLPARAADIGEDVSRDDLRQEGAGSWYAPCGRTDDLSAVLEDAGGPDEPRRDEIIALGDEAPGPRERVVRLRFAPAA